MSVSFFVLGYAVSLVARHGEQRGAKVWAVTLVITSRSAPGV